MTAGQNNFLKSLINIVTGRVARNVYFWIGYFLNFYQNYDEFRYGPVTKFFLLSGIILFLCLALYLNNLLLLPKYFARKRYGAYFIRFAALLLVSACGVVAINYFFDRYFPLEHFSNLTMISLDSGNIYQMMQKDASLLPELLFGGSLAMLIFYFFFFMAWFMNDYFVQQKRLEQALKEKLETDLALIKYQISPHFLFNTLNNLYGMALIGSAHLPKSLLDLASILRYILYESSTDKIHFDKEKEILDAYIQLELLRLQNTDNLSFEITADANYNLPPLLWLPVLENIFKHGTRHIAKTYSVDFRLSIENKTWVIASKNKFRPGAIDPLSGASGMGLVNLRRRLEIIYPGKHQITEKTEGEMYSIFIKIDLE